MGKKYKNLENGIQLFTHFTQIGLKKRKRESKMKKMPKQRKQNHISNQSSPFDPILIIPSSQTTQWVSKTTRSLAYLLLAIRLRRFLLQLTVLCCARSADYAPACTRRDTAAEAVWEWGGADWVVDGG
jgi:hypothetical protein